MSFLSDCFPRSTLGPLVDFVTHLTDPQEFSQFLFSVEAFSGDDICLMSLHCFCKLAAIALNSAGSTLASNTDEGIMWLLRRVSEFSLLSLVFCFSVIMYPC